MEIPRDRYVNRLIARRENGLIKIITGIRRSGKSYLLFRLYRRRLLEMGVPADHIISLALDDIMNIPYRDPMRLYEYIRSHISDNGTHYVFLDEIQLLENGLAALLNGLQHLENLDVYVTGSNSRFLSSDIPTEFRGRGDEVRIFPFSFSEFAMAYEDLESAWQDYYTYGGMPQIIGCASGEVKADYLRSLFDNVYVNDIKERYNLRPGADLDVLVDILASSVGSLTNPIKLAHSFQSAGRSLSDKTIKLYLEHLEDAFLVEKAVRFDVKGKRYLSTPAKYYFEDVGLRNARLNFRQQEPNHIMENIIYTELRSRGYHVDVGVVEVFETLPDGKRQHKQLEIDFVANKGNQKYYVQSAFEMPTTEKKMQEKRSLSSVNDSFRKIIVVGSSPKPFVDEDGVSTIGIKDFLMNEKSLEEAGRI